MKYVTPVFDIADTTVVRLARAIISDDPYYNNVEKEAFRDGFVSALEMAYADPEYAMALARDNLAANGDLTDAGLQVARERIQTLMKVFPVRGEEPG